MSALLLLMAGVMTSCSDDDAVKTLTVAPVYGYMN